LGEQIGSGAQGTVHRAVRIVPEGGAIHEVCVKLLGQGVEPSPALKRSALRETEIAARLQHPNTVSCIEARPDDPEGGWIAMEFVDGVNLRALLRSLSERQLSPERKLAERQLSPELAVFVASEICKGLVYLHSQRRTGDSEPFIVHHDLKSANVLIGRAGFVKLADFGLARVFRAYREPQTIVGGTLQYMAPEQADGKAVDVRSDLFSLGVVLYEMLAGNLPVEGLSDGETKRRLATADYPSIRKVNPNVSPALESIVACLMQPEPSRRFQTARACLRAFSELCRRELPLDLDLCLELGELAHAARRHQTQDMAAVLREHRQRISDAVDVLPEPTHELPHDVKHVPVAASANATAEAASAQDASYAPEASAEGLRSRPQSGKRRVLRRSVAAAAAAVALPLGVGGVWNLQLAEGAPARVTPSAATAPAAPPAFVAETTPSSSVDVSSQAPQTALTAAGVPQSEAPASEPAAPPSKPLQPAQKKADKQAEARRSSKRADAELTIGAMPSAQVWVDGKSVGWSPVVVNVRPGQHSVGIGAQKPDKKTLKWITVQDGERIDVLFDDQPLASADVRNER
jgi:serine/threonine-protein kinase